MNDKDRFLNVLQFKSFDRVPNLEACTWWQTKDRWEKEGLPEFVLKQDYSLPMLWQGNRYFGLDELIWT